MTSAKCGSTQTSWQRHRRAPSQQQPTPSGRILSLEPTGTHRANVPVSFCSPTSWSTPSNRRASKLLLLVLRLFLASIQPSAPRIGRACGLPSLGDDPTWSCPTVLLHH